MGMAGFVLLCDLAGYHLMSTINSFNRFPQRYATDLNLYEMAARGIAVLNIGLLFELVAVFLRLHIFVCTACAAHTFQNEAIKNNDGIHLRRKSADYFELFLTEVYNGACEV